MAGCPLGAGACRGPAWYPLSPGGARAVGVDSGTNSPGSWLYGALRPFALPILARGGTWERESPVSLASTCADCGRSVACL